MKPNVRITGAGRLKRQFNEGVRQNGDASVAIGYTANYAVYVHEMINATFKRPGAEAKFLEKPLRELKNRLLAQIEFDLKRKIPLKQALYRAGLTLQRASMEIVPVDTGNLRASAFTRIE